MGSAAIEEFLASDIVVLGCGFYNFGIPSQLKSWVDRIVVVGRTFRYTEIGPEGLAGGKRVVLAIARGGFYGPGTPAASFEHAETYLRNVFAFIGIPEIEVISAEGMGLTIAPSLARLPAPMTTVPLGNWYSPTRWSRISE